MIKFGRKVVHAICIEVFQQYISEWWTDFYTQYELGNLWKDTLESNFKALSCIYNFGADLRKNIKILYVQEQVMNDLFSKRE